jgi:hypothetical protein
MAGKTAVLLDFFATNEILNLNYLLILISLYLTSTKEGYRGEVGVGSNQVGDLGL